MTGPLKPSLDAEVLEVIMTLVADQKLKPGHHEFKLSFELKEVVNGYDIFDQYLVKLEAKPSSILPTAAPWEGGS